MHGKTGNGNVGCVYDIVTQSCSIMRTLNPCTYESSIWYDAHDAPYNILCIYIYIVGLSFHGCHAIMFLYIYIYICTYI